MATQLVLVQSLGVRVLPPEQEAALDVVATMTAALVVPIRASTTSGGSGPVRLEA